MKKCIVLNFTQPVSYNQVLALQKKIVDELLSRTDAPFYLLLLEHLPVFTIGKNATYKNLLYSIEELKTKGYEIFKTDRGGDVTYHGPGQLVGYPILNLKILNIKVKDYVHMLEDCIITLLKDYNIYAFSRPPHIGVWLSNHLKIASIGIHITRHISYHGFALNVNNSLHHFQLINPCGYKNVKMTSIKEIFQKNIDISLIKNSFVEIFEKKFSCNCIFQKDPYLYAKKI